MKRLALTTALMVLAVAQLHAQEAEGPVGFEVGGLPAINFDSDEGFGYGALVHMYEYGEGGMAPYVWTLQPTVFLTTQGRRDLYAFFDSPHLLPDGWRIGGFLGYERQIASPYYGVGNETVYDEELDRDDGPNPYFYRFGRTRSSGRVTLQRSVPGLPIRVLVGGGVERTDVDPVPKDSGTTLFETEYGGEPTRVWSNFIRGGLVWDTRDRESWTTSGTWTEALVWWVDDALGADYSALRWTVTDRRYLRLGRRLVFAHRIAVQSVGEEAPVQELFRLQTSFRQQEGLGGSKTVRGVLRNRFVGRSMFVWNAELRWRAAEFRLVGRDFHSVLSVYLDQGRVWSDGVRPDEILSDLHRGYGGGVRVGMGENFVVALDGGTSAETGLQIYIGLGYLY